MNEWMKITRNDKRVYDGMKADVKWSKKDGTSVIIYNKEIHEGNDGSRYVVFHFGHEELPPISELMEYCLATSYNKKYLEKKDYYNWVCFRVDEARERGYDVE